MLYLIGHSATSSRFYETIYHIPKLQREILTLRLYSVPRQEKNAGYSL